MFHWLVPLVMLASLLVCFYGLSESQALTKQLWQRPASTAYGAIGIVAVLLLLGQASRRMKVSYSLLFLAFVVVLAAGFSGLGATTAALLQLLSGFCIGRHFYRDRLVEDNGVLLASAIATATGLALLSVLVGLLSLLPLNNPAVYLLMLLAPIVAGWKQHCLALQELVRAWNIRAEVAAPSWVAMFNIVIAFSLLMRLLAVLYPEIGTDALAMHLVIADQLKVHGRFHYDVTQSIWAVMPLASDWQFAIANMLADEPAARLVNFGADMLIIALIYQYGTRAKSALAGAVGAAVYAATPLIYLETTSLFVENFWTLWFIAALLVALSSLRAPDIRSAAGAGLLLGTALAAKVITIFAAPFFLIIAIGWFLASRPGGLRKLTAFAGTALVASIFPYLNAWLRTGNPVFPFMNDYFKSPYFEMATAMNNPLYNAGADWKTLYDVTFRSASYLEGLPGSMGIGFFVLLPAAIVFSLLHSRRLRLGMLCSIVFVALVFHFQSYLRYILPVMPVFAVLIGLMTADVAERSAIAQKAVLSVALACALIGLYLTPSSNYLHREISMPIFAGSHEEQDYLERNRPERRLAQVVDALNLHKVLWLGSPYIAGADTDVYLVNWQGGWTRAREFDALQSGPELQRWIAKHKFEAIAVAADFKACDRQFICDFLEGSTKEAYKDGSISLNVIDASLLFGGELLVNPGFTNGVTGWGGKAEYKLQDGAVTVSALNAYSQAVPVVAGTNYFLEVHGRCTSDRSPYRAQVNWLGKDGAFINASIDVINCTPEFVRHASVVTAPAGAATAMVYASGHLPDKTAEITMVSLKQ